jgi:hypothetical protein
VHISTSGGASGSVCVSRLLWILLCACQSPSPRGSCARPDRPTQGEGRPSRASRQRSRNTRRKGRQDDHDSYRGTSDRRVPGVRRAADARASGRLAGVASHERLHCASPRTVATSLTSSCSAQVGFGCCAAPGTPTEQTLLGALGYTAPAELATEVRGVSAHVIHAAGLRSRRPTPTPEGPQHDRTDRHRDDDRAGATTPGRRPTPDRLTLTATGAASRPTPRPPGIGPA